MQLKDPKPPKERKKTLLLGLHEKCWHATADRLHAMLEKAGMPKEVLALIKEVVPHECARCRQFAHAKHRPRVNTLMGKHFNNILQCNLFTSGTWSSSYSSMRPRGTSSWGT